MLCLYKRHRTYESDRQESKHEVKLRNPVLGAESRSMVACEVGVVMIERKGAAIKVNNMSAFRVLTPEIAEANADADQ